MLNETQTSICNKALALLGEEPINSLDDNSTKQARICKLFYALSIRSVLERGQWSFATVEAPVQRIDIEKYTKEQKFVYRIPTDCALVVSLSKRLNRNSMHKHINWDIRYIPELKAQAIICNANSYKMDNGEETEVIYEDDQILMEYIVDNSMVNTYSAAFIRCVTAQLAADICMPVTHDPQRFSAMMQLAQMEEQKALQQSLNEDGQDKRRWIDPLTASRGRMII